MKHLLVPTDFSKAAENALDFAARSSEYIPCKITVVHSFEVTNDMYIDYLGQSAEFHISMVEVMEEKLDEITAEIREKYDVEVTAVVSTAVLQDAISDLIEERDIDMVVMGTLGTSGVTGKFWGSRTSSVIMRSSVPVLAIPADYQWKKPETILLATNKFLRTPNVLDFVFELAGLYLAEVHTAVFTNRGEDKAGTFLQNQDEIVEYGAYLREKYHEKNLSSAHLYGDDFEETVEEYIAEKGVDILTMVTRQKNFWQRLFDPSVTRQMSFHTKIPLLAIPEKYKDQ